MVIFYDLSGISPDRCEAMVNNEISLAGLNIILIFSKNIWKLCINPIPLIE